jgi:hypothetical protein
VSPNGLSRQLLIKILTYYLINLPVHGELQLTVRPNFSLSRSANPPDARDKRRTQDVPAAAHTQFKPGMLVAIDKAIDADSGKLGAGLALPFRIVSVKDVTAYVGFVAPSLTTHPLRFDVNVRQLRTLGRRVRVRVTRPRTFWRRPTPSARRRSTRCNSSDFVLNGLMPAKWRDRIVKFLKKHIQLAQDQARQDAAVRQRTLR